MSDTASNPYDGLIERLRVPSNSEGVMAAWDNWRKYIKEGGGSSWPRDAFENLLSCIDEEREEAAEALSRLARDVEEARCALIAAREIIASDARACKAFRHETEPPSEPEIVLDCIDATLTRLSRTDIKDLDGADRADREPSLASRLGPSGDHHGERKGDEQ